MPNLPNRFRSASFSFVVTWAALWFAAGAIVLIAAAAGPPQAQRLSSTATLGRYVSAGMTLVDVTQDSLARLAPWLGASQSARTSRISKIRNGVVREPDSVLVRLSGVLDSLFYARLDTLQVPVALGLYQTAYGRRHPRPVVPPPAPPPQPPPAPAPIPPAPPPPPPPPVPGHSLAIDSAGLTGNGATYYVAFRLPHGIPNGALVRVQNHHAVPSFDDQPLYAKALTATRVSLWRDAAMTVGLRPTTVGAGGTIGW